MTTPYTWLTGAWLPSAWLAGSWGDETALDDDDDSASPFARRGRHWRPGELEPLSILPPRKRPRRRRREELLVIAP
jgi:hypothetical protein